MTIRSKAGLIIGMDKEGMSEDSEEYARYLYQHSSDIEGELAYYVYNCWLKDTELYQSDMEYKD